MTTITPKETLYNTDYYRWMEETIERLRSRDYEAVDWENLIEELEGMNRSDKRALASLLTRLYEHLLKLLYWESERAYNANKWRAEITTFRIQIRGLLKDSPSLKPYLAEINEECYRDSIITATRLFGFPVPDTEIAPLDRVLDNDWFPEIDSE